MQIPLSVVDEVATSESFRTAYSSYALRGSVYDEFCASVVGDVKSLLQEGTLLCDLTAAAGSCATMWTRQAQEALLHDNRHHEFRDYDLGLEGQPFSPTTYANRVRDAVLDGPIADLAAAVRDHITETYGVDPCDDAPEWT